MRITKVRRTFLAALLALAVLFGAACAASEPDPDSLPNAPTQNADEPADDDAPVTPLSAERSIEVDFDLDATVWEYINRDNYTALSCTLAVREEFDAQYETDVQQADVILSAFRGSAVLLEAELDAPGTVGFSVTAEVEGPYKVAVISGGGILQLASSYDGLEASRPIEAPAGKLSVILVGEDISGELSVRLYP